jgi:cysteine-rich repeat protein
LDELCNTMRTSILTAAILGLFAFGCAGELTGTGEGDDDPSAACGNGAVEGSEVCDDGNTTNGDGCSSSCTTEQSSTPKLNVTVDKPTIGTELGKTETITLNLQSQGGFTGDVTIAMSIVDGANAPITSLTATGPTTVTVAADVTTTAQYVVTIPSDATGTALAANLKLDVTSSLGTANGASAINVTPIFSINIAAGTGAQDPMHPLTGKTFTVRRGTKLRMINTDTVEHISHGGGGIPHEPGQPGAGTNGQPGATYEVDTTPIAPGGGRTFGCHTHGAATYANITIQ